MENYNSFLLIMALALSLLIAGCTSPSPSPPPTVPSAPPAPNASSTAPPTPPAGQACADKVCFISAANVCQNLTITSSEDIGVLRYSSTSACVFTKTLVTLNANETDEMKTLLQGKSMTCRYGKGKFDPRLVNSLLFGSEYCEGELKDILAELITLT